MDERDIDNRVEIKEEERLIYNIIWNASSSYGYKPLFMAKDFRGGDNFYMNNIIGFAYKYFPREFIEGLFKIWEDNIKRDLFDNLAWLALESTCYKREVEKRPVLLELRIEDAKDFFKDGYELERRSFARKTPTVYAMTARRKEEVLKLSKISLSKREKDLARELDFPKDIGEKDFKERLLEIFDKYLGFDKKMYRKKSSLYKISEKIKIPDFVFYSKDKNDYLPMNKRVKGKEDAKREEKGALSLINLQRDDEEIGHIKMIFGKSIFSEKEEKKYQEKYCKGGHKNCHIYYAYGEYEGNKYLSPDMKKLRDMKKSQEKRNRDYYINNKAIIKNNINRLSNILENALYLKKSDYKEKSYQGKLDIKRIWRANLLGDEEIFIRDVKKASGDFSIDLIIDGSASRMNDQEKIANQAYILAESLKNSNIKTRIISYSTVFSYTAFQILKDFDDENTEAVFKYFAYGWNRDGLAFRALEALLERRPHEKHLIIILTDSKPMDLRNLARDKNHMLEREYQGRVALEDSKLEIDKLKRKGYRILGLYSGGEKDRRGAEYIFSGKYENLLDIENMAKKIASLIYGEILEIEK